MSNQVVGQDVVVRIVGPAEAEKFLADLEARILALHPAGVEANRGVVAVEGALGDVSAAAGDAAAALEDVGAAMDDVDGAAGGAANSGTRTYFTLERIASASMASAGALKAVVSSFDSTTSSAEKVNGVLDGVTMMLAGFGPIGQIAAAAITGIRVAIDLLADSPEDLWVQLTGTVDELTIYRDRVKQAKYESTTFGEALTDLWDVLSPERNNLDVARTAVEEYAKGIDRATTAVSLLEEVQIRQAAQADASLTKMRQQLREQRVALQVEIDLLRGQFLEMSTGPLAVFDRVITGSRLKSMMRAQAQLGTVEENSTPFGPATAAEVGYTDPKTKTKGRGALDARTQAFLDLEAERERYGAMRAATDLDVPDMLAERRAARERDTARITAARNRSNQGGGTGELPPELQAELRAGQESRGMGLGKVILAEAENTTRAGDMINGALGSITSSFGQFAAQAIASGKISAKAIREWAANQLFAVGSDAIGKGLYLEALAAASAIFGLGIATGPLLGMGAALIGTGAVLVGMSAALGGAGGGSGSARRASGGGGGGRGVGSTGGDLGRGAGGNTPINLNVTVGIEDTQVHDAVARVAVREQGARGRMKVMVAR